MQEDINQETKLNALKESLRDHLVYNHYPSVKPNMIPICIQTIKEAKLGNWDKRVEGMNITVDEMVRDLHLQPYVYYDEEIETP